MKVLHSFTARILAIMVALLLLFCAVSTLAWYRSFTREAVETAQAHLDTVIETLNETFEESLREIDYTTAFISNKVRSTQNNCVVQFLTAQESNAQIASLQQARSYLFNRCNFKAYLNGVSIYGFDGRICTYGITTPYDEVSQTEWFSQIQSGQADVVYLTPHAYTSKQPSPKSSYVFSIVRPVLNNGTIIGVIKADVKSSLLETIFDIQEMQGYALYVFDRDTGEAVYVPEGADTLPLTRFQDSVPRGHGSYTDQIGGADCLVVYTTSEITPWQIVGVVRQNTVISGFLQVRNRMLLIVLLCAALFAVIAFALAHYLTKDLRRLTRAVEQTGDEALELPIRITRQDEVGILYQRICAMLARIRTLITNIRCAEAEKRTSEIAMLSMQINPHFLYNTLHTIKVLSIMQGVENIQTVTDNTGTPANSPTAFPSKRRQKDIFCRSCSYSRSLKTHYNTGSQRRRRPASYRYEFFWSRNGCTFWCATAVRALRRGCWMGSTTAAGAPSTSDFRILTGGCICFSAMRRR